MDLAADDAAERKQASFIQQLARTYNAYQLRRGDCKRFDSARPSKSTPRQHTSITKKNTQPPINSPPRKTLYVPRPSQMNRRTRSPSDLAAILQRRLYIKSPKPPPPTSITNLIEVMFAASLKTEEGQSIRFNISYIDPKKPDPNPPRRIVRDRWISVPFSSRIPFTTENAVKLAKATDPRTSSFAVYHTAGGALEIWGLVDQNNRHHEFMNFDVDSGSPRPGLFQAEIRGLGHLVVTEKFETVAELHVNAITTQRADVWSTGPIAERIRLLTSLLTSDFKASLTPELLETSAGWDGGLSGDIKETLCRVLSRVRDQRHGGALIITPDQSLSHLRIKFKTDYTRIRTALKASAASNIENVHSRETIFANYLNADREEIPASLYLREAVSRNDLDESRSEIDGVIWFVSLLSRIDGTVVLTNDLTVRGFGAEITCREDPTSIFKTTKAQAKQRELRQLGLQEYGTRHRSMMRYCNAVPGSVGFVVSQDGDVRAITKVDENLILWDTISLQRTLRVRARKTS
jgi:hypothetical protein